MSKRKAAWACVAAMGLLVVLSFMFTSIFRSVLFPAPSRPDAAAPVDAAFLSRELIDGEVEAWFLAGDGVSAENPGPLVIYAHGNGELIDSWPMALETYRSWGISILLGEYRGYGRSAGQPSQADIGDDFRYFYDQAKARPDVDGERIFFHGRSLGGGVVSDLARTKTPRALVLESTFTSVTRLAKRMWVPGPLVPDPFDSLEVVGAADYPVILFHGEQDRTIPVIHGRDLAAAAPDGELHIYPAAGHNDLPRAPDDYWRKIEAFLVRAGILLDGDRRGR